MGGGAGLAMGLLQTGMNIFGSLFGKDKKQKQVSTRIGNVSIYVHTLYNE